MSFLPVLSPNVYGNTNELQVVHFSYLNNQVCFAKHLILVQTENSHTLDSLAMKLNKLEQFKCFCYLFLEHFARPNGEKIGSTNVYKEVQSKLVEK